MSPISLATGGRVKYNTTWRGDTENPKGRGARRKIADVSLQYVEILIARVN